MIWWVLGEMVAHGADGIALQVVDARGAPRPGVNVRVGRDEPVTTDAFGYVRLPLGSGRHTIGLGVPCPRLPYSCGTTETVRVSERTRVRTVRFTRPIERHVVDVMSTTRGTVFDHDLLGMKRLSGW